MAQKQFLPISKEDMKKRGWDRPDFVFVIGDAYVDHSSFGPAIISRVLESHGYKVAIISQPDWKDESSVTSFNQITIDNRCIIWSFLCYSAWGVGI